MDTLGGKDLREIGFPETKAIGIALNIIRQHYQQLDRDASLQLLQQVLADAEAFKSHEHLAPLAEALTYKKPVSTQIDLRKEQADYSIYGAENIEEGALEQMNVAMRLPVTVAGALMPDAHQGYGLPIGGVLAAENAVIPYGVGVDIGCRMCLSLYDISPDYMARNTALLKRQLQENTRFGNNSGFPDPIDDEIFSRPQFRDIRLVKGLKDKAYKQIGSSGSGNHFVEYGVVELLDPDNEFGLAPGKYLGVLSHSGSRGLGATIANHYTKIAMEQCILPAEAKHLAWLDLDSEAGQEYWQAMNLAGDYASACHHHIHKRLSRALGEQPLAMVENHHNFAWKEKLADGREVIVHRKGATPAAQGVLGVIPGSMTAPGFIVRGKGKPDALQSASHGAGRQMSRRKAMSMLSQDEVDKYLKQHGIELIGGGLDEAPMAYKDINKVMDCQADLVEVVGVFTPRIVRMDG